MPPLGIMVEVPAVAVAPALFARAAFFSIGSNDLTQYVTASARDIAAVAALNDPAHPAVMGLIANVAQVARSAATSASAATWAATRHLPALVAAGLRPYQWRRRSSAAPSSRLRRSGLYHEPDGRRLCRATPRRRGATRPSPEILDNCLSGTRWARWRARQEPELRLQIANPACDADPGAPSRDHSRSAASPDDRMILEVYARPSAPPSNAALSGACARTRSICPTSAMTRAITSSVACLPSSSTDDR
jgi:hypothetical protein